MPEKTFVIVTVTDARGFTLKAFRLNCDTPIPTAVAVKTALNEYFADDRYSVEEVSHGETDAAYRVRVLAALPWSSPQRTNAVIATGADLDAIGEAAGVKRKQPNGR